MNLPPELDFLKPLFLHSAERLLKADWLLSDFYENQWEYSFGFKKTKLIDWNVELEDGSRLTDQKHNDLLLGLKYFLTGSVSEIVTTSKIKAGQAPSIFAATLHIIDALLLNSKHFKLAKFGLGGLGRDNLKTILTEIASSSNAAEAVYGWSKRLSLHCLELLIKADPAAIQKIITEWPEISEITPSQHDNNTLDIPLELIPKVRAALHINGVYRFSTEKGYVPNSATLSKVIYANTLKGCTADKPILEILTIPKKDDFKREFPPVPVTTGGSELIGQSALADYKKAIYGLGILHEIGLPAPSETDLIHIKNLSIKFQELGRHRTLPAPVVFSAVKDAIEFHLKHGRNVIDGWCRVAIYCRKQGISLSKLTDPVFRKIMSEELKLLGVENLGLSRRSVDTPYTQNTRGENTEYFRRLRCNRGLIELVKIYTGCVQLVVGALMGRRVGELRDLHASNCLDTSFQWLIFQNRKSTYRLFGTRQTEARPIEPIAVNMIKNLIRMQKILKRLGFIQEMQELFCSPSIHGDVTLSQLSTYTYNQNLDLFCDYFETLNNEQGQRYYIRQHQLRRFFALLFFHSSSFGGLETLQWMLGHVDATHIWNYITETVDGVTLKGAKVQYIAEDIHNGHAENYQNLADLLKAKYQTYDFTVVDAEELEDYLADLMEKGTIEIEPDFFEGPYGQKFRLVVKIKEIQP